MRMIKKVKENNYFHKLNISTDILLDSLTKVISRRYIMSYVTLLVSKKIPFSYAIIDIDNFKNINDTYGHMIGDKLLINVANVISEAASDNCYIGRFGGDEFIIVYEGDDSYDSEWHNLKNIFNAVRKPMTIDILTLNVTCSAGCSSFPKDGESVEEIFKKSDRLLYRAKLKGRNCFVIYVKEKHQDLDYVREVRLPIRMNKLYGFFKGEQDTYFEIYEALLYLASDLKSDAAGLFENDKPPLLYRADVEHTISKLPDDVLENHYKNGVITINMRSELERTSRLRRFMEAHDIRSLAIIKVQFREKKFGYIMFYQARYRVWQEDDIAILKYLATIVAMNLYYKED